MPLSVKSNELNRCGSASDSEIGLPHRAVDLDLDASKLNSTANSLSPTLTLVATQSTLSF